MIFVPRLQQVLDWSRVRGLWNWVLWDSVGVDCRGCIAQSNSPCGLPGWMGQSLICWVCPSMWWGPERARYAIWKLSPVQNSPMVRFGCELSLHWVSLVLVRLG